MGYEDDLNLYLYVRNDPLNLVDPLGLDPGDDCVDDPERCDEEIVVVAAKDEEVSPFQLGFEYFTGTGPAVRIFDENDQVTQDLATAPGIERARRQLCENLADDEDTLTNFGDAFGVDDLLTANTLIEQYVGSYSVSAAVTNGRVYFTASNTSSFTSLAYGSLFPAGFKPPNWNRGQFGPMGNTQQFFTWSEPLECE